MKRAAVAVFLCLCAGAWLPAAQPPAYRDASRPVEDRVRDLLGRMTLEEKFWQLFMIPGSLDAPAHDYSRGVFGLQIPAAARGGIPSARGHAERINAIQRYFVEQTRLGIPIIPFEEALHGLASDGATMFPQAVALAATWDQELVGRVAAAAALETRSRGIRQVLSPVINIADDVRWGRVEETYGEAFDWYSVRWTGSIVAPPGGVARRSDAAIVVAGVEEGEFRDRARLGLPGRQEDLIRAVAAAGRPTVVVLIGGSAITMSSWLDRVGAVIDAWYPGEQGGHAVADVLFGDTNPAGRLPVTFPISEGQLPLHYNHKPTGRGDDYVDLTGMPLFPFGFGLSYTTFAYSNLRLEPAVIAPDGTATIRCSVKNTGTRAGDEVVQLYLRDVLASMARPVMELKGFRRVRLEPGASAEVSFTLGPEELRMLDRDMTWIVEPGAFRVMIGSSSKDIRLRGELTVK